MTTVVDLAGFRLQRAQEKFSDCQHRHLEVDEKRCEVICKQCNALLNPIWVLAMIATRSARDTVVCEHCGKQTRVK